MIDRKTFEKVLENLRGGMDYSISGFPDGTYVLNWNDTKTNAPTDHEIADEAQNIDKLSYIEKRIAEYPPVGEQLDAIFKGGQDFQDMAIRIQAVKNKYPKPI